MNKGEKVMAECAKLRKLAKDLENVAYALAGEVTSATIANLILLSAEITAAEEKIASS